MLVSYRTYGQSVNIGLRFESFTYLINKTQGNSSDLKFMPLPLSGYLKAGVIFYDKYELELKTGVHLTDPFTGYEYAILFKYNLLKNFSPLISYLNHLNVEDSGMGYCTYGNNINFIGLGIESKVTKLFCLDIVCYLPVAKNDLEYEFHVDKNITTTKMGPLIKLGFIFNIIRF